MAKLDAGLLFTGTLQNISAYKMRGSGKIILRMKGGASKEKIQTDPNFDIPRRNYTEFGGRSTTSKWILRALQPLKPVADHSLSGALNRLLKPVQEMDTAGEFGRRSVAVSRYPGLLEGFSLNRETSLEAVVQNPLSFINQRDTLSAKVEVPALIPGINFTPQSRYSVYRIVAVLGIVPDLFYNEKSGRYVPGGDFDGISIQTAMSEWFPVKSGSVPVTLSLQLPAGPQSGSFSLVLSAGICYGQPGARSVTDVVKYNGCGRILSVV